MIRFVFKHLNWVFYDRIKVYHYQSTCDKTYLYTPSTWTSPFKRADMSKSSLIAHGWSPYNWKVLMASPIKHLSLLLSHVAHINHDLDLCKNNLVGVQYHVTMDINFWRNIFATDCEIYWLWYTYTVWRDSGKYLHSRFDLWFFLFIFEVL